MTFLRKFFRAVRKSAIFIVMCVYVSAGIVSAVTLYAQEGYRSQPLSALGTLIDAAAKKGDTTDVAAWLSARPLAETDAEVRLLTPKSGVLGPPVFFAVFRRELKLGRLKEALFWLQLGRFRLQYDLLRCGATPKQAQIFKELLSAAPMPQIDGLLVAHPQVLKESLQRVLDFDAKYPPTDDPKRFCKFGVPDGTRVERGQWPLYRQALRRMTEEYIKTREKTEPAEKPRVKKYKPKKPSKTPAKKESGGK